MSRSGRVRGEREGVGSEGRGWECQRARTKVHMRHLDDSQSSVKYTLDTRKRLTGAHLDRSWKNSRCLGARPGSWIPSGVFLKRSLHFEADQLLLRRFPRRTFYRAPRRRSKRAGSPPVCSGVAIRGKGRASFPPAIQGACSAGEAATLSECKLG